MRTKPPAKRGTYFAWALLSAFVVVGGLLMRPAGVNGWQFALLVAGAVIAAAAAATRQERAHEPLWLISGFLMGGATIRAVFHGPFDARQAGGIVFLAALLIFYVSRMTSTRRQPATTGLHDRTGEDATQSR